MEQSISSELLKERLAVAKICIDNDNGEQLMDRNYENVPITAYRYYSLYSKWYIYDLFFNNLFLF